MATIPQVATTLRMVLTTTADVAAQQTHFVQRRSKLTGALFCQTLVFGWLANPAASLDELAQMAATCGVRITAQALHKRFSLTAAACLKTVVLAAIEQTIAAPGVLLPLLQRFAAVYLQDSSTIVLPKDLAGVWEGGGKKTGTGTVAALKTHLRIDLLTGSFTDLVLTAGRRHDDDALFASPLKRGSLRIADLGYFSLQVMASLAEAGVLWLSWWTVRVAVFDATGTRRDVVDWLHDLGRGPVDLEVTLGVQDRLPCRLLAIPVAQPVADARRRRLRQEARRKGQTVSQARLRAADWDIMLTSVPRERLNPTEARVLLRARWQMELIFKLWKSRGQVDEWRTSKSARILCEVYAKLLAMILQHWIVLVGCWALANRSWVKAARTVQSRAVTLASTLRTPCAFTRALRKLLDAFEVGCVLNPRKAKPNCYQLILNPELGG